MKRHETRPGKAAFGSAVVAALLAGCAVGPNYQRPSALGTNAMPTAFAEANPTNFGAWKPAEPSAHLPRGAWWELFGDTELNRFEGLATANNQQLASAYANFQQARALVNVARADFFPQLSTTPSFSRQRNSANMLAGSSATFNTFNIPLQASWEIGLWGTNLTDAQYYDDAVLTSVSSRVAYADPRLYGVDFKVSLH